jgi:Uma2 family endonuclease
MNILTLNLDRVPLSDEPCLSTFPKKNSELKFEGKTKGVLIIRFPVAGDSVNPEADLISDLGWWNRKTRLGSTFSASTVFKLPNGADRSFDAAWI